MPTAMDAPAQNPAAATGTRLCTRVHRSAHGRRSLWNATVGGGPCPRRGPAPAPRLAIRHPAKASAPASFDQQTARGGPRGGGEKERGSQTCAPFFRPSGAPLSRPSAGPARGECEPAAALMLALLLLFSL